MLQFPISDRARRAPKQNAEPQSSQCRARSFSQEVRAKSFWDFANLICDAMIAGQLTKYEAREHIEAFIIEQGEYVPN